MGIARAAHPRGSERQQVQPVDAAHIERNVAHAGHREPRGPARDDGEPDLGGDQVDDRLLLLGDLRNGRPQAGPAAATGIATINSIGNLGGFAGPSMTGWIKDRTGSFEGGLYFVAALLAISAVLTLVLSRLLQRAVAVSPAQS